MGHGCGPGSNLPSRPPASFKGTTVRASTVYEKKWNQNISHLKKQNTHRPTQSIINTKQMFCPFWIFVFVFLVWLSIPLSLPLYTYIDSTLGLNYAKYTVLIFFLHMGRKSKKKKKRIAYLLPQCKYDKFTLLEEDTNYILNSTCEFILVGKKEEGSRGVKCNHRRNFTE